MVHACGCNEISSRRWEVNFGAKVALDEEVQKRQNGVSDLDFENQVKVQRSRNIRFSISRAVFNAESKCLVY